MSTTSQQSVSKAINTAILASVGNLIGNRVYELRIPDNKTLPLCRYQILFDENINMLSCSNQIVTLQVNFFGDGKQGIKALRGISDVLFADFKRSQIDIQSDNPSVSEVGNVMSGVEQGAVTLEEDGDRINIRQEYRIQII